MRMTDDFIETTDLDWFAAFSDNNLAHFTSGGSMSIPEEVKNSINNYEVMYNYFLNLKYRCDVEIIEENLPCFTCQHKKKQYLKDYINMASKGVFSYDINNKNNYLLIVKPIKPLSIIDLPTNIKQIVYKLPEKIKIEIEIIS